MAFTITPYSFSLNTNMDNCNFGKVLTQGSTDFKFIITILKDNVEQTVDSGAKITLIVEYNVQTSCGVSSSMSNFVLSPDNSNYDITVDNGKIEVPGRIELTNAKGINMLELKIEDGPIAYTRKMLYTVKETKGYTTQSIPDNLPKFEDLKAEITQVKADTNSNTNDILSNTGKITSNVQSISTNKQDIIDIKAKDNVHNGDIAKAKQDIIKNADDITDLKTTNQQQGTNINTNKQDITDLKTKDNALEDEINDIDAEVQRHTQSIPALEGKVQTNTNNIVTKANKDMTNVGEFSTAKEGDIFYKKDGELKAAPINVNDVTKKVTSEYSLVFPPDSLYFSDAASIHTNGGFLEYNSESTGKDYLLVDYENDPVTGSKRPVVSPRAAEETRTIINSADNVAMNNISLIDLGNPAFGRQVQRIYFKLINAVTNLKIRLNVNNKDVAYYPTKKAWNSDDIAGYNIGNNEQFVDLKPFWSSLKEYNVKIYLKADSQINMFGDGTKVWMAEDLNRISNEELAYMSDLTAAGIKDTAGEIRDKLETLLPGGQFSYNHLDDKPLIPTIETGQTIKDKLIPVKFPYSALEGVPATAISKFLDLTDVPSSYLGSANKFVRVNSTHNGLEFVEGTGSTDVSDLAKKDLSNIDNAILKTKTVSVGMLQQDLEDIDIDKLDEKIQLTDTVKENIRNILSNSNDITDIQNELSEEENIYSYIGQTVPTLPTSYRGQYYLKFVNVSNDLSAILPDFIHNENGTVYGVINTSLDYTVTISPPDGYTIDGDATHQVATNTFTLLVKKDNTRWVVYAEGSRGITLKDGTHTINDVQNLTVTGAVVRDDLHGKATLAVPRQVEDLIEYGTSLQSTTPLDDTWIIDKMEPNQIVHINATSGNKYLILLIPTYLESTIEEIKINNTAVEHREVDQVYNNREFKMLISTTTFNAGRNAEFKIVYNSEVVPTGLEIDDGTNNKAGIKKINVENMKLSKIFDDSSEVTLTADGITGRDNDNKEFPVTKIQSLDGKIRVSNLGSGTMDLDADYNTVTDGIFAKLGMDEDINTDFHDQRPYFGDSYDNTGRYVGIDFNDKGYTIQEGDMLDPNVTGGSTFNIGMYFEPLDYNVVSNDGYIELKVVELNLTDGGVKGYLNDIDGNPIAIRREYKAGTQVGKELLLGIVRAKGQKRIAFEIDVQFGDQILRASSNTCIYIQETDNKHNSGLCELLFQRHTGYTIHKTHRYYGTNNMNLAAALVKDKPEGEFDNTSELMGNGIVFDTRGKCKVEIKDYHIILQDNGTDLPVFSLGKIWDEIDTTELRLKTLNAKVVITDKQNAFIYALMKWTGAGKASLPILSSYNNGNPVFNSGWTKVSQKFISEDVVSGDHTDTNAFTVPDDAKQMAIIIYPSDTQTPTVMKLKDFEIDVVPNITKTIIQSTDHITEEHLKYEKNMYKSTVYTESGYASYRYTVGNVDTKLPVGVIKSGDGKIINDNSWHDAGSSDINKVQGDFKFLADGQVTMDYEARCFNEQGSVNQIQFWLAKVNDNGSFTEVPNSKYASTIEANRTVPKFITSQRFTFEVKANETYRFFGKSDKADGFYVQSNLDGRALLKFVIDFNEIKEYEQSILDRISDLETHSNEITFVKNGQPVPNPENYKMEIDVDTGRTIIKTV